MDGDSYRTIASHAQATYRDKGSRFLAYAWPVSCEGDVKPLLDSLRKKYYDATHHCYAWRLGQAGEQVRVNDDGEPSGTAGKPIMGQILSRELTNLLIVVVRYFGGTKLGVPGLINAYREAAREVIDASDIVEKTVNAVFRVRFSYLVMNEVMRVVKEMSPVVLKQNFDNVCEMELSIRRSCEQILEGRMTKCEGVNTELLRYE